MTHAAELRLVTPDLALLEAALVGWGGFKGAPQGVGAVWRWRLERPPGTT